MLKIIFLFLFFLNSLFAKDVLTFASLPMVDKRIIYDEFYLMVKFLEKELGKKIVFFYSDDYYEILENFKNKKIDMVYLGPLPYVKLKENYDSAIPLVHFKDKNNSIFYTCSLIKFMKSEKKEKIALTQALSTCGYLSVNNLLDNKLEDYQYAYLGKHDDVAINVLNKKFDLGGVRTSIAKDYYHLGIDEVSRTGELPGFALIGNRETLGIEYLNTVKQILLNIKKDDYSKWGKDIKYGMQEAFDEDYRIIRTMLLEINIPLKDKINE